MVDVMIAIDNIATLDFPSFTPYKIVEMINNKQMTFDNKFQRAYIWRIPRMKYSALIQEYKKWRRYFYN